MDNLEFLRTLHAPYERGESDDFQPLYDCIAHDVVYDSPVGRLTGKPALIDFFDNAGELIDYWAFHSPIEYFRSDDRVLMRGEEKVTVKETGVTFLCDWAWAMDMHDGVITRIVHYLHSDHLPTMVEALAETYRRTRESSTATS